MVADCVCLLSSSALKEALLTTFATRYKRSIMLSTILLALTLSIGPAGTSTADAVRVHSAAADQSGASSSQELQLALRDLWSEHIFWVRSYVVAAHYDDARGAEAADMEVVENARAIADAIAPLYGDAAADQLFELLAGHYGAIAAYMKAHNADDSGGKSSATNALTANAEALATFLSGANPHLPKNAVFSLLAAHGGHHIQQIAAIHAQDFAAEAQVWEAMRGHMNTIADALAGAIVKQFPDKFTS